MFCATAAELPLDKYVLCNGCSATFRQICFVQLLQCYLQTNMFYATAAVPTFRQICSVQRLQCLPLDKYVLCNGCSATFRQTCSVQRLQYYLQTNMFCATAAVLPLDKYVLCNDCSATFRQILLPKTFLSKAYKQC